MCSFFRFLIFRVAVFVDVVKWKVTEHNCFGRTIKYTKIYIYFCISDFFLWCCLDWLVCILVIVCADHWRLWESIFFVVVELLLVTETLKIISISSSISCKFGRSKKWVNWKRKKKTMIKPTKPWIKAKRDGISNLNSFKSAYNNSVYLLNIYVRSCNRKREKISQRSSQ